MGLGEDEVQPTLHDENFEIANGVIPMVVRPNGNEVIVQSDLEKDRLPLAILELERSERFHDTNSVGRIFPNDRRNESAKVRSDRRVGGQPRE